MTLGSTAKPSTADGTRVKLGGAALALDPPSAFAGLPADSPLGNLSFTDTATASSLTIPQIGTGTWIASVSNAPNAPFGAVLSAGDVVIPAAAVGATTPAAVPITLQLKQSLATLEVAWDTNTCLSAPATGTMAFSISKDGGTALSVDAAVSAVTGGAHAVAELYLPPGSYTFSPTLNGTDWSGGSRTFTVGNTLVAPASVTPTAIDLVPSEVPVAVSMTVNNSGSAAAGITITANDAAKTATPLGATGTGSMCLAPATGVSFTPSSADGLTVVSAKIATVSATGANVVPAFAGYTLAVVVKQEAVAGRIPDAADRDIDTAVKIGNTTVWSDTLTIAAGDTSVTGPTLIVGASNKTLTATPPTGDAFGQDITAAMNPTTTHTVTATLPYELVMLTATVKRGTAAQIGAAVKLTPADGTIAKTTPANGTVLFQDLDPGTYAIGATWSDTSTTPATAYSGSVSSGVLAAGQLKSVTVPLTAVP